MNQADKNRIRIEILTTATVEVMNHLQEKNPGGHTPRPDLFPRILRRSGWLMEESDDMVYENEAIAPPDEGFLHKHWKDVKLHAARTHRKYIIPETDGFYLGTLEEWCQITTRKDKPILDGIVRSIKRRARIAKAQGGSSPTVDAVELKQLGSGDGKDSQEDE